jgi:hypothetical protein
MTGENSAKKDRDPIFTICLAIFVVAAVIAVGAFIVKEYFPANDQLASTGDTVSVNYIGTFYDAYGNAHAVVFDTSYSNIGNDGSIAKSNDFTQKSSYSPLSYSIGGTSVLKKFGDAAIGHKVGDKYSIVLTGAEAYYGAVIVGTLSKTDNTMPSAFKMSKTDFTSKYKVDLVAGATAVFTTDNGWDATAVLTDNGKYVLVTIVPEVGKEYTVCEQNGATVKFTIKSISDGEVKYSINIENPDVISGADIEMLKVDYDYKTIYITGINNDDIFYKEGTEIVNEQIYFQIELVSIG